MSIGDRSRLVGADIEAPIVIGDMVIECSNKLLNSLIGGAATIRTTGNRLQRVDGLTVRENSTTDLWIIGEVVRGRKRDQQSLLRSERGRRGGPHRECPRTIPSPN